MQDKNALFADFTPTRRIALIQVNSFQYHYLRALRKFLCPHHPGDGIADAVREARKKASQVDLNHLGKHKCRTAVSHSATHGAAASEPTALRLATAAQHSISTSFISCINRISASSPQQKQAVGPRRAARLPRASFSISSPPLAPRQPTAGHTNELQSQPTRRRSVHAENPQQFSR